MRGREAPFPTRRIDMSKRVFMPFNTWGLVVIGMVTLTVMSYSIAVL